ncbi:MAG: PfkB family carbohydrate kinase [Myxococcota bacterium]
MRDILQGLRRVQVGVLGDVVLDRYVFGTTNRISREAPVPVVLHEREEMRPGGAANAAVNAAVLGSRVSLLGVVGRDEAAARFRECMRGSGVKLHLVVEKGRHTAQKLRVMAGALGTRHQQVLRLDRDPVARPHVDTVRNVVATLRREAGRGMGALLLSDYGQGFMDTDIVDAAVGLARKGLPVVVDSRYALGRARGPVVLKPNAPELGELAGAPVTSVEDVVEAARAVLRRQQAAAVVATRGREGMVVVQKGGKVAVLPAHGNGEVTDVTGAGDTVAAALTAALGAGVTLERAASLANVAASVVVGKLGAATASPDEILAALEAS